MSSGSQRGVTWGAKVAAEPCNNQKKKKKGTAERVLIVLLPICLLNILGRENFNSMVGNISMVPKNIQRCSFNKKILLEGRGLVIAVAV